jgi:phosphotransferase system enzyme I (PtsI)
MLTLHGAGIGKGITIGTAFVLQGPTIDIPDYMVPDDEVESEVTRFENAIQAARSHLSSIRDHIPSSAPSESAMFIEAHLLMMNDPLIASEPLETIRNEHVNAEAALQRHAESLVRAFEEMEDPYLRDKKTDINQVVNRIQQNLLNVHQENIDSIEEGLAGKIVITTDLAPADTVLLKHHKMSAFVTDLGGPISHTAIMARSLKIPAIVGLHGATRYIRHGETLIVDGKRGTVILSPDQEVLNAYHDRYERILHRQKELESLRTSEAITRDGQPIQLMANIELPEDIEATQRSYADGVGLYRTEYLFMNRQEPPTEAEQFSAYKRVVTALERPITIRTLDLGADKQVDGGRPNLDTTTNPALGLRAVRLCLNEPGLFKPQLRAILRASAFGPIEMMIPMVSSLDELDQVLDLVEEIKQELRRQGHAYDEHIPIGGMIEVPAAAIAADLFASRLNFLSIGTNDLIQYTLAIDRVDDSVNYLYDPLHPSVLRLIKMTIDAGNQAGVPVAMCGEMAGESKYTRLLLGLGLRNFSMEPDSLLEIKKVIRDTDLSSLTDAICEIMACSDANELRMLVGKLG